MQLIAPTHHQPRATTLRCRLGLAVLSLLAQPAVQADTPLFTSKPAELDVALLRYQESAGRVQSNEAVVRIKQEMRNEGSLDLHFTVDSLTGGSPNGALPSKTSQTFTKTSGATGTSTSTAGSTTTSSAAASRSTAQAYTAASGGSTTTTGGSSGTTSSSTATAQPTTYTVAPGALPLDRSFQDQRVAFGGSVLQSLDALTRLTLGGDYSHETDFQSLGASLNLARDVDRRNTTFTLGLALEGDSIHPNGGTPVGLSDYGATSRLAATQNKRVLEGLIGVSQIMTRRWVTQLNYSLNRSSGYQNDPYKIVSVLDASGATQGYVHENRPDNRRRVALYWGNKVAFDRDRLDFSLRSTRDDWGIRSHTVDLRYRWAVNEQVYLEPNGRYYRQTAADFYRYYLLQSEATAGYASADPRLASFDARTLGLKLGYRYGPSEEISLRLENYQQRGRQSAVVLSQLQGLDLYPGLQAWVVQLGLKSTF